MEFKEFLHPISEVVHRRTPDELLKKLIRKNLKEFSEKDIELVRDYAEGRWLSETEIQEVKEVIATWFKGKYNCRITSEIGVNNILRRESGKERPVNPKERFLENERFLVTKGEQIGLKNSIIKKFPEETQGIELLFGLREHLEEQEKIKETKVGDGNFKDIQNELLSVGEYQFTLTNFILSNQGDKQFVKVFWQTMEEVALAHHKEGIFLGVKRGILSHVAGHEIMEKLRVRPRSVHPRDDVFLGIDEVGRRGEIIQYKTGKKLQVLHSEIEPEEKQSNFGFFKQRNGLRKYNDFIEKIKKTLKNNNMGRQAVFYVEVPPDCYDEDTGKVKTEIIETITPESVKKLENYLREEVLRHEDEMRQEILLFTSNSYKARGKEFDEERDRYQVSGGQCEVLLKQCLLRNTSNFPENRRAILFGYIFNEEDPKNREATDSALGKVWKTFKDAPSFDNKEAVGDYLFRRYLRDVDYGWKKRDMARGAGVSGGK